MGDIIRLHFMEIAVYTRIALYRFDLYFHTDSTKSTTGCLESLQPALSETGK